MKKLKVEIDRSNWLYGEGENDSYLLRGRDGKMCCLGFVALACGADKSNIEGLSTPKAADDVRWPAGFITEIPYGHKVNSCAIDDLMTANDRPKVGRAVREERIARMLSKFNIDATFIGEYSKRSSKAKR